jgi:DeoR family transcriptional regulator of aga operon
MASSSTNQNRRESIVQLVRQTGFVRNSELSSRFGVSTVTIRQDIDALSAKGLIQRTYGGAVLQAEMGQDTAFALRSAEHVEAKRRIGAAAAKSIRPGETILLDSGSTTMEIARQLPENADITVVTPALNIALEAGTKAGVTVVVCGGRLNPRTLSTAGQETARHLAEFFADRLFLATYGVDFDKGLAERSLAIAETKRALIASAREITLVCDSSKFGCAGPVLISPLGVVRRIVTDDGIPPDYLARLRTDEIDVELV